MAGTDAAAAEEIRTLQQLLAAKEIVISCGSGGVGKTTTAAALGAMAAAHLGGKVLVLTVDPARRLANALGLERFGNAETRVDDEAFAGRRRRAPGRAVGRHARHQAVVGRPDRTATPPTRRPARRSSPTRSTPTSRAGSSRATTTSRWSGSTTSTRRVATT